MISEEKALYGNDPTVLQCTLIQLCTFIQLCVRACVCLCLSL